ncbi:hypothetical protein TNCV_1001381 [Trichonephila clavipes]|nr:hypothetical protein TNCV_1001381 [Trichonephila clavipes]
MNFGLQSSTRAIGGGPRNFETWLGDKDDTSAGISSSNHHADVRALSLADGHGSVVVKVVDLWLECHEFEPSTAEDPPCGGGR